MNLTVKLFKLILIDMKMSILSLILLYLVISCVCNAGTSVVARILTLFFLLVSQPNFL